MNPLKLDPTRTGLLRKKYLNQIGHSFNLLIDDILQHVVVEDALGLKPTNNVFCPTGPGGGIDPTCSPKITTSKIREGVVTSSITYGGYEFKTGQSVTFEYMRNTQPSPNMGSMFQQDIEIAGRYMIQKQVDKVQEGWESGTITFKNPLVIPFNTEPFGGFDDKSWKVMLTKAYKGKKGKALANAIANDGYDGIVTVDLGPKGKPYDTREIIDLTYLHPTNNVFCATGKGGGIDPTCSPNQTHSEAFKQWFGKSKIKTKDGEPKVLYHGTNQAFEAFTKSTNTHTQVLGVPVYFATSDADLAGAYAASSNYKEDGNEQIKPLFAKMERPLVIDAKGANWDDVISDHILEKLETWRTPTEKRFKEFRAKISKKFSLEFEYDSEFELPEVYQAQFEKLRKAYEEELTHPSKAIHKMEPKGVVWYDGMVIKNVMDRPPMEHSETETYNPYTTVYAVFDPTHFKSASGNRGTYDPKSPVLTNRDKDLVDNAKKSKPAVRKADDFMGWLNANVSKYILNKYWTDDVVNKAHRHGVLRGFGDKMPASVSGKDGAKEKFLRSMAVQVGTVQRLRERAFSDLEDITAAMGEQIGDILSIGFANSHSRERIALAIVDRVKKIGLTRARILVNNEISRAHSEGVLDALEYLGETTVGFNVEWRTASDPCDLCSPLQGMILTIAQARGLFPRHCNCRCSPVPVSTSTHKSSIRAKINRSMLAEIPKTLRSKRKSAKQQRRRSKWMGANR